MPPPESGAEPKKEKPQLSQVVSGIVSSVVGARAIADASALRVARFYLQNELLKGLPVPRMRFRRVSINFPVLLDEFIPEQPAVRNTPEEIARLVWAPLASAIQDTRDGFKRMAGLGFLTDSEKDDCDFFNRFLASASDQYEAKSQEIMRLFVTDLRQEFVELDMAEGGGKPSDTAIANVTGETAELWFRKTLQEFYFTYVDQRLKQKDNPAKFDPNRASSEFDKIMQHDLIQGLSKLVRHHAEIASVLSKTLPPDFRVDVNTDIVKNAGGGANSVTNLSFVLLEEGLEWMTETRDGVDRSKLTLE